MAIIKNTLNRSCEVCQRPNKPAKPGSAASFGEVRWDDDRGIWSCDECWVNSKPVDPEKIVKPR